MSDRLRCELCGIEDHDVLWKRLVEWTDDQRRRVAGLPRWDAVNRCRDYQACRARREASDRPWPVRDIVTRPTVRQPEAPEEVPV